MTDERLKMPPEQPSDPRQGKQPPAAPPPPAPPPPGKRAPASLGAPQPHALKSGALPTDRPTYYAQLKEASPIGDICRELIGERITGETATEIHVDCPHHESQSNRSLHVSLLTGLWNCFGCGKGGDVIQLAEFIGCGKVTKCSRDGVTPTHVAAVSALASRAGLPQYSESTKADADAYSEYRAVFAAMTETITVFYERLIAPEHEKVLRWFQDKYGITRETIQQFRIGWSGGPVAFDEVVARGHKPEHVRATGLFRFGTFSTDTRSFFDKRIVFPYWSHGQAVYAIGRRTHWTDDNKYEKAKYKKLNLYDENKKSRRDISRAIQNPVLYGADILQERPDVIVLTEGITDAIACQQAGFPTVSPVTVRLKKEEVERAAKLLRSTKRVVIVQDNELSDAGLNGALDTAEALERYGTICKVAELPLSEKCTRARDELAAMLGADGIEAFRAAKAPEKRKVLKSRLASRPDDLARAEKLVEDSKIDLCDYLKENPGRESVERLLGSAVKPIEILIERAPQLKDPDEQLEAIKPILARIYRMKAPFSSDALKKLREKLGRNWTLGDLRKVGKDAAGDEQRSTQSKAKSSGGAIEPNDNYLGDEFVRQHGVNVRYCDETKTWALWDGTRWRWDNERRIDALARTTVEPIGKEAAEIAARAAMNKDEGDAKLFAKFSLRALSMAGVQAAKDVAGGTGELDGGLRVCLPLDAFDPYAQTKHLLNCQNGVLNLRTRELIAHADSKTLHITKIAPIKYVPEATCPQFLNALWAIFEGDVDPERATRLIELLQLSLGYSLLGDQTHHLLFFLYGPEGRNGKSVLVIIVLGVLGSDCATNAPPGLLREKRGESHPTELTELHGRRVVAAVETGKNEKLNEALVKHLTGGDMVKARGMREDFWSFQPTHHLLVATNSLPRADAQDRALWARFRVIPFRRRFLKKDDEGFEECPEICRADDGLADRILEQEAEGVFAWMVEGTRKYLEAGGVPNPPESREAVAEYREDNDPVGEWIEEMCETAGSQAEDRVELGDEWWSASSVLYERYHAWAEARGNKPLTDNSFGRALTAKGFPSHKARAGRGRLGIRVRAPEAPLPPIVDRGGA